MRGNAAIIIQRLVRRRTRLWRDNQIRDACTAFRRMCLDDIAAAEAHARRARVMARIAQIRGIDLDSMPG